MASELYQKVRSFREHLHELDDVVKSLTGASVVECLYAPADRSTGDVKRCQTEFSDIRCTHPAIFMVEYALYRSLCDVGIQPGLFVGSSLGEVTAAAAAGVIPVDDAMRWVVRQADVFHRWAPSCCMYAVLESPHVYGQDADLSALCDIAGISGEKHFVVAAELDALDEIERVLRSKRCVFARIPVKHGFHTRLIDAARDPFMESTSSIVFNEPLVPTVSSAFSDVVRRHDAEHFWSVVRQPIRIDKTLEFLAKRFAAERPLVCVDASPASTFAGVVSTNAWLRHNKIEALPILSLFGGELAAFDDVVHRFGRTGLS